MQKWLSISFVVIVLAGTVGIPFYQHACLHENTVFHTVFVPSSHCEEMEEVEEALSCCKVDVVSHAQSSVQEDDCCKDDVKNWRFSCFYSGEQNWTPLVFFLPKRIEPSIPKATHELPKKLEMRFGADSDPPPLAVLERLSTLCIWRL